MDIIFWVCFVLWFFGYYWIPQKYHNPNRLLSSAFFRPPIMIYLKMIQKLQFTNWLFLFQGNETREIFFSFKVNKVDDAARKIRKEEQIHYVPLYLYLFPHPYVIPMYRCGKKGLNKMLFMKQNYPNYRRCGRGRGWSSLLKNWPNWTKEKMYPFF